MQSSSNQASSSLSHGACGHFLTLRTDSLENPYYNKSHNHDLKNLFKSTATTATQCGGLLQDFYLDRVARGMKPALARLTLARKIAAITLTVWKKGERFNAERLKQQAA